MRAELHDGLGDHIMGPGGWATAHQPLFDASDDKIEAAKFFDHVACVS